MFSQTLQDPKGSKVGEEEVVNGVGRRRKEKGVGSIGPSGGDRRGHEGRSSRGHRVDPKMSLWFPGLRSITESKEASI